jgi:hypothetical protein
MLLGRIATTLLPLNLMAVPSSSLTSSAPIFVVPLCLLAFSAPVLIPSSPSSPLRRRYDPLFTFSLLYHYRPNRICETNHAEAKCRFKENYYGRQIPEVRTKKVQPETVEGNFGEPEKAAGRGRQAGTR